MDESERLQRVGEAGREPLLNLLRALSDEELEERHDLLVSAKAGGPVASTEYYLAELARRRQDRQARMLTRLTWVITVLTAVNVIVAVALLCTA